ncbi:hypothetical protein OA856_00945 [Pelagibacteraceae bacterium]|nr:hypothetical protein [Pelagibacteraceae bacterium]
MDNNQNTNNSSINLFDIILVLIKSYKLILFGFISFLFIILIHHEYFIKKNTDVSIKYVWNYSLMDELNFETLEIVENYYQNLHIYFQEGIQNEDLFLKAINNYDNKDDINDFYLFINVEEKKDDNKRGIINFSGSLDVVKKKEILQLVISEVNLRVREELLKKINFRKIILENDLKFIMLKTERAIDREAAGLKYDINFLKSKLIADKKNFRTLLEQSLKIANEMGYIEPALSQIATLYAISDARGRSSIISESQIINERPDNINQNSIDNIESNSTTIIDYKSSNPLIPLYFYGVRLLELEIQNIDKNYKSVDDSFFTNQFTRLRLIEEKRNLNLTSIEELELVNEIEKVKNVIDEIDNLSQYDMFKVNFNKIEVVEKYLSKITKFVLFSPIIILLLFFIAIFVNEFKQRKLSFTDLT